MIGTFTSPAFAQQFKEPIYEIRGGEVLSFEIDPQTGSLIISLDIRARGEIIVTLPRSLIDAKIGSQDTNFEIFVGGILLESYDETKTSSDRTVTIPFRRGGNEIEITGTQVSSQGTAAPIALLQEQINKKIELELRSEMPEGEAKLLIFSDTRWSGALQAHGFDYIEIAGQGDKIIIFGCETPPFSSEGLFRAKIQKLTKDGYLKIVAIQNQKLIARESVQSQSGEIDISGACASSSKPGLGGGGCLIATATFGSELAPQVQQLRELRDNKLLQTNSGSAFMSGFNQFYYLFSPTIADWERENTIFKETVKLAITPLLTSLSILNYVDIDSEEEMLGYGIGIILINLGMYFGLPIFGIIKVRKLF